MWAREGKLEGQGRPETAQQGKLSFSEAGKVLRQSVPWCRIARVPRLPGLVGSHSNSSMATYLYICTVGVAGPTGAGWNVIGFAGMQVCRDVAALLGLARRMEGAWKYGGSSGVGAGLAGWRFPLGEA